jgi:hypothetical protein
MELTISRGKSSSSIGDDVYTTVPNAFLELEKWRSVTSKSRLTETENWSSASNGTFVGKPDPPTEITSKTPLVLK